MADKTIMTKSVAAAVGVAFVSALAASTAAADNPFELAELDSGYMFADSHEGEEGKWGEKGEEGACDKTLTKPMRKLATEAQRICLFVLARLDLEAKGAKPELMGIHDAQR